MQGKKVLNNKSVRVNFVIGLITLLFAGLGYIVYLLTLHFVSMDRDYNLLIFVLSWLGILLLIYVLFTWYKITNSIFTPYSIFMVFFFLFNYGQSLMWAFGIHNPNEIGKAPLYPGFAAANDNDIVRAQFLTLLSILMFHMGAILSYKKKVIKKSDYQIRLDQQGDSEMLKSIYFSSLFIGIVVIPITLYFAYSDLQIASTHGYKALYYSEFANKDATFLGLLTRMFFPCLVGLLIGSKFSKKVRVSVYIVFSIYLMLNLLSGDRGSWIYKLIILVWLSHTCYKTIGLKTLFKYSIISIIGIHIINAMVSLRNTGLNDITFTSFRNALSFENSVFLRIFFEMGGSMKPTIFLQSYGWDVWPYANSYFLAVLGVVTNKVIYALDIPFSLISSWFSHDYLGLSWGAGFSIIAESLLNFGPFFAPVFMIILGYIITSLIYVDKGMKYDIRPLRFLFVVSTLHAFIPVTRNYFHFLLKDWFYGVLILCIFILLVRLFFFKYTDSKRSIKEVRYLDKY